MGVLPSLSVALGLKYVCVLKKTTETNRVVLNQSPFTKVAEGA